jgi:hypothetical protein
MLDDDEGHARFVGHGAEKALQRLKITSRGADRDDMRFFPRI